MKISEIISGNQSVYESPLKKRERSINPYDDEGEELKLKYKRHSRSINKSITSDGGGVSSVRTLKRNVNSSIT